ncbi:hypothetical protein JVU11DRAFT_6857 [Chiua virens]|nr:hypothetical protein JVU11DRAFT_6857 [Chiua virens]
MLPANQQRRMSMYSQTVSLGDSNTALDQSLTQPSDLSSSDLSNQSTLTGEPALESTLPAERDESSKLGESIDTATIEGPATPDRGTPGRPETTPCPVSISRALSCPHLVSRSDEHIIYDRYFRSTYAVDGREGWVYHGSRRMFWLPDDLRPASPTALAAFEDTLVILTRSRPIVFIDMRPTVQGTGPSN